MHAEVELSSTLTETQLTVRELNQLKEGDIIPLEVPEKVTGVVEDIPVFRGVFGSSGGKNAIKVTELIKQQVGKQLMTISGAGQ